MPARAAPPALMALPIGAGTRGVRALSCGVASSTASTSHDATAPQRTASGLLAILAVLAFGTALVAVWRGNEFAATWFYDCAWWSYIVFVDAWVYRRRGASLLWSHPRAFVLLALWSAAFWLFFEVVNFRLQNWYYVGVPRSEPARSIGICVSFATVLPGIFETGALLGALGAFERARCRPWNVTARWRGILFALGAACLVLPLCFPRYAFPLIWGTTVLMTEAWLLGRGAGGLLSELTAGRIGTVWRWLAAGLVCGLLWETWNACARAHWIYTVPFFEDSKLFEMPLAGFLGFPPFALECYSFARVLVALRLVPEWEEARAGAASVRNPRRESLGALAAAVFALPAILGLNAFTVRATRPTLDEIPGLSAALATEFERAGIHSPEDLLAAAAAGDGATPLAALEAPQRQRILDAARLMHVRGLGARGLRALSAAGIHSVEALARADPETLHERLLRSDTPTSPPPTAAEVRVWVRGARLEH